MWYLLKIVGQRRWHRGLSLPRKHEDLLELRLPAPTWKPGVVVDVCNPSSPHQDWKGKQKKPWEFWGLLAWLIQWKITGDLVSNKVEGEDPCRGCTLTSKMCATICKIPIHTHEHTCTQAHTYAHTTDLCCCFCCSWWIFFYRSLFLWNLF